MPLLIRNSFFTPKRRQNKQNDYRVICQTKKRQEYNVVINQPSKRHDLNTVKKWNFNHHNFDHRNIKRNVAVQRERFYEADGDRRMREAWSDDMDVDMELITTADKHNNTFVADVVDEDIVMEYAFTDSNDNNNDNILNKEEENEVSYLDDDVEMTYIADNNNEESIAQDISFVPMGDEVIVHENDILLEEYLIMIPPLFPPELPPQTPVLTARPLPTETQSPPRMFVTPPLPDSSASPSPLLPAIVAPSLPDYSSSPSPPVLSTIATALLPESPPMGPQVLASAFLRDLNVNDDDVQQVPQIMVSPSSSAPMSISSEEEGEIL